MDNSSRIVLQTAEAEVIPGETARYPFVVQTGARLPVAAEFGVSSDNAGFDPRWARVVRATDELRVIRYQLEITPVQVGREQYGRYSLALSGRLAGLATAQCVLVIKPGVRLTAKPTLETWPGGKLTLSIENFGKSGVDVDLNLEHHGSSWSQGWDLELEAESGPVTFSEEFDPPENGRRGTFKLSVTAAGVPVAEADLAGRTLTFPRRKVAVTAAVLAAGGALGIALATADLGGSDGSSTVKPVVATSRATPSGQPSASPEQSAPAPSPSGSVATSPAAEATGSPTASQSADKQGQAITFSSVPPASAAPGDTYLVTATGGPSGETVTFTIDDLSASVCTVAKGTVTFSQPGDCLIDANQAGNGQYLAATQAQQAVAVAKLPQTITFTSTPPTDPSLGPKTSYTVTATGGGSDEPVTFSIDSSTQNFCKISGDVVTYTRYNASGCLIDANQQGDDRYQAAPLAEQPVPMLG